MNEIRIFLIDDHGVLREGLQLLLDAQPDMLVVGESAQGRGVVEALKNARPDVVILDVSMPDISGAHAAAAVREALPELKILALTRHDEKAYVQQMLAAGASGYVLKRTAAEVLVAAIRSVAAGGTYLDPAVAGKMMDVPVRLRDGGATGLLTTREQEVLSMVALGHSNKEIAATLGVTVKTIETHKSNGMAKLDLHTRAELVRFALAEGWMKT